MGEYELYHHGVKGMKWGVRKKQYDAYRKEYDSMNKNRSALAKGINRLAGSGDAYAKAKMVDASPDKTSGIGSYRSVSNHAKAKSTIAAIEARSKGASARQAGKAANAARDAYIKEVRAKNNRDPQALKKKVQSGINKLKSKTSESLIKAKTSVKKLSDGEMGRRGKAAVDVLMNGDTDWMGNHNYSDNSLKEIRNRGKAAIERLMYSEEQIDNKKFFGRYDF